MGIHGSAQIHDRLDMKGGEAGMSKPLSRKALLKEASFWSSLKKAAQENPGKTCRK
jgi:hypothetical protein